MNYYGNIDILAELDKLFEIPIDNIGRKKQNQYTLPEIEKVIFNDPATIIYFKDGTKTVVKTDGIDEFVPEVGFAMAVLKKLFGSRANYLNIVEKYMGKELFYKQLQKKGCCFENEYIGMNVGAEETERQVEKLKNMLRKNENIGNE